jgi:hypothetical protein
LIDRFAATRHHLRLNALHSVKLQILRNFRKINDRLLIETDQERMTLMADSKAGVKREKPVFSLFLQVAVGLGFRARRRIAPGP